MNPAENVWTIPLLELDCPACASRIERELARLPGIREVTSSTLDATVVVRASSDTELTAIVAALRELEFDPSIVRIRLPTSGALLNGSLVESVVEAIPGVESAHADPIGATILVDYVPTITSAGAIRDSILRLGYPTGHSMNERSSERSRSLPSWVVPSLSTLLMLMATLVALPPLTRGMRLELAGRSLPIARTGDAVADWIPAIGSLSESSLAVAVTAIAIVSLLLSGTGFSSKALRPLQRGNLDENVLSALAILILLTAMIEVYVRERPYAVITAVEIAATVALVQLRVLRLEAVRRSAGAARNGLSTASPDASSRTRRLLTENALRHRAAVESAGSRANRYVPLSLLLVALASGAADWLLFQSLSSFLFTTAAVLLAVPPSLLLLAVAGPYAAVLHDAAACGYFFKGGEAIGRVSRLRQLVVGRRGVLLENVPRVSDFLLLNGSRHSEILGDAGALSSTSQHPVSRAIMQRSGMAAPFPPVTETEAVSGKGLSGVINGEPISIGQPAWLLDRGIDLSAVYDEIREFATAGKNVVLVEQSRRIKGAIALQESLLPTTMAAAARIRQLGIATLIASEGNTLAVRHLADQVGIGTFDSNGGKVRTAESRTATVSYRSVALSRSAVSIVIDDRAPLRPPSADLAITRSGLLHVANAIRAASASARRARRNLLVAGLLLGASLLVASGAAAAVTGSWTFLAASTFLTFVASVALSSRAHWSPE